MWPLIDYRYREFHNERNDQILSMKTYRIEGIKGILWEESRNEEIECHPDKFKETIWTHFQGWFDWLQEGELRNEQEIVGSNFDSNYGRSTRYSCNIMEGVLRY